MRLFITLLLLLITTSGYAQFITHGPAIGGLTPHNARMYLRTASAQNFAVQLSQDSLFTKTRTYAAHTIAQNDTTAIVELNLLQPNKRYFYRVLFNDIPDAKQGSFRTFPPDGSKGNYVFATGSCQETPNMKVFDVITQHQPNLFLHTGDWTYPSYQLDNSYPANYETVKKAWQRHYEELQMKEMLLTVPIDYVPDDDDGFGPTRNFWWGIGYTQDPVTQEVYNFFTHDTITPIMRSNVMRGYTDFFPGYTQLPDTSIGLYHSFIMGNCEFFFLDTRSNADVPTQAYTYDAQTNRWAFNPPPGHKIIGDKQMQWLKNGLKNSTADWKFLVGGVPFNKNIRLLIDFALNFQNIALSIAGFEGTGFRLSASFSGYWAGYPEEQNDLLNFIAQNDLKDVIVLSGDTHHNVMDNGENAGLPELNASGLSVTGTNLAYFLDLFSNLIPNAPSVRNSIWNSGGNGLGNNNFKNAFGKVEVFQADSVRLSVIDEDNAVISYITLPHSGKTQNTAATPKTNIIESVYPIPPTGGQLIIRLHHQHLILPTDKCYFTDLSGKQIASVPISDFVFNTAEVNTKNTLLHGIYLLVYEHNGKKETVKVFMP